MTGGSDVALLFKNNNIANQTAYTTFTNTAAVTSAMTGSVTLAYNYTPAAVVPEPSTYALLCISLGVVGFAKRKMKSNG